MAQAGRGAQAGPELTAFQLEVARLFFGLPASKGFLLAGGAAPLAQHLTTRPTEDLDFFTAPERGHVPAVNAPPDSPASPTAAGPTLAPEELAGHKLLALFDRAAARDFAGVYVLARRFGKDVLLARASQIDAGFDPAVLASMLTTLDRFTDDEIPLPDDSTAAELQLIRPGPGPPSRPATC